MLYNPQLQTFINVADAGSFNKAAEHAYVTPSAVIKQINLLESDMGVRLFDRTHRGIVLTEAGSSFYDDANKIIALCERATRKIEEVMKKHDQIIRIGTSPMMPPHFLMQLWPKVHEYKDTLTFQFVPFDNTIENVSSILKNLGVDIDVVAGIFDPTLLARRECAGTIINEEPLCVAVALTHRLAEKDRISIDDLYGENLRIIQADLMQAMDILRQGLVQDHPAIHLVDFPFYNTEIFNECENSKDVLVVIQKWEHVHPLLKIIPVDWNYSTPFGILHEEHPSEKVRHFIEALQHII